MLIGDKMNEELYNERYRNLVSEIETIKKDQKEKHKETDEEIKSMKKEIRENSDLKYTLQNLSNVVNELKVTVNELNSKDGKAWNQVKWVILSGVIMSILSFILGQIW